MDLELDSDLELNPHKEPRWGIVGTGARVRVNLTLNQKVLLGTAETACNWIAHKINKIPHDKENTKDSSTI